MTAYTDGPSAHPVDRHDPSTAGRAGVRLIGAVLALALPGCGAFSPPASIDPSVLEPLPAGLELVGAGTYPCRGSGDIGWEYEYVVVLGDDGEMDGRLHSHLEEIGFGLRPAERDDWVVTTGEKDDIRVHLGPVDRWRDLGGRILEGPPTAEVKSAVGDWDGPAALIGLEPTDKTCEV
jgi:hypothetical protein